VKNACSRAGLSREGKGRVHLHGTQEGEGRVYLRGTKEGGRRTRVSARDSGGRVMTHASARDSAGRAKDVCNLHASSRKSWTGRSGRSKAALCVCILTPPPSPSRGNPCGSPSTHTHTHTHTHTTPHLRRADVGCSLQQPSPTLLDTWTTFAALLQACPSSTLLGTHLCCNPAGVAAAPVCWAGAL